LTLISSYTYDSTGRLLTVTKDGNPVEEYSYDISGTRISETNTLRGIVGRTFSYSDEDHLLSAGSVTYAYDPDGFLTTKTGGNDITDYTYSSRGELLNVTLPDNTVVEYMHEPLGRRIAKKIDGVIVEKYLWQGLTRLLAVYDGSDNLLMRFEYAGSRMAVAMASGGTAYYLTYDQIGSLRLVADSAGNVVKLVQYDSFGNVISDSNPTLAVPFGFAGGLYDPDTKLLRFGYRDYDPDIGRWTAKDPIGFAGGDTDLYGYVLNNPVNSIDPFGLLRVKPGYERHFQIMNEYNPYAVAMLAWVENQLPSGHEIEVTESWRTFEEYKKYYPNKGWDDYLKNKHAAFQAFDIKAVSTSDSICGEGVTTDQLIDLAKQAGFKGIGVYDKHIHIDMRDNPASWKGISK